MKLHSTPAPLNFDPHQLPGMPLMRHPLDTRVHSGATVNTSLTAKPAESQSEHQKKLAATAGKWVAQTFFGTLLKQAEDSPFHSDIFEGGHGGQAFKQLLDQHLVEHMSRGAGGKLVNSIVRRLAAKESPASSHGENANSDATHPQELLAELNQRSSDRLRQVGQKAGPVAVGDDASDDALKP